MFGQPLVLSTVPNRSNASVTFSASQSRFGVAAPETLHEMQASLAAKRNQHSYTPAYHRPPFGVAGQATPNEIVQQALDTRNTVLSPASRNQHMYEPTPISPRFGVAAPAMLSELQVEMGLSVKQGKEPSDMPATMSPSGGKEGGRKGQGQDEGRGQESGSAPQATPKIKAHFKYTELCRFYLEGTCLRGTSCSFAHDVSELKEKPNFVKTRPCAQFSRTGRCAAGGKCSFAHGKEEMRRAAILARKSKRASKIAEKADVAPGCPIGKENTTALGTVASWRDAATTGGMLPHEQSSAGTGIPSFPERSDSKCSDSTTSSEHLDSSGAEEQDAVNSLFQDIGAFVGTKHALELIPGKVFRL